MRHDLVLHFVAIFSPSTTFSSPPLFSPIPPRASADIGRRPCRRCAWYIGSCCGVRGASRRGVVSFVTCVGVLKVNGIRERTKWIGEGST